MSNSYSTKLFARPSALEGVSRLLDLGATMQEYNGSETETEADLKALSADWQAVGRDINDAIEKYEQETI